MVHCARIMMYRIHTMVHCVRSPRPQANRRAVIFHRQPHKLKRLAHVHISAGHEKLNDQKESQQLEDAGRICCLRPDIQDLLKIGPDPTPVRTTDRPHNW